MWWLLFVVIVLSLHTLQKTECWHVSFGNRNRYALELDRNERRHLFLSSVLWYINNNNMRILERFAMHLPFFPSICVARLLLLLFFPVQLINSSIEYSVCTSEKEHHAMECASYNLNFWILMLVLSVDSFSLLRLCCLYCCWQSNAYALPQFKPRFGLTKQNKTNIYSFNRTNWLSMVQYLHMIHTESERQYVKSFHRP